MSAKYILRLDDACPTMNSENWTRIENLCDKYNVKPIVAVVPNNKDEFLKKDEKDENFWKKVQQWQNRGWHIALHGYDHVYTTQEAGLVPFNNDSEFAGLSLEEQRTKIMKGLEVFKYNGIRTKIWVAPSHSFDKNTLKALEKTSIKIISDGIGIKPFKKYNFNWIPQQVWHFRKMPFGTWTGCFHPNEMTEKEFINLENFLKINHKEFISIDALKYKKYSIVNMFFSLIYWNIRRIKNVIKK